jgi:hypothetical protein
MCPLEFLGQFSDQVGKSYLKDTSGVEIVQESSMVWSSRPNRKILGARIARNLNPPGRSDLSDMPNGA